MGLLASFHLYLGMDLLLVNNKISWNFDNTQIVGYVNFHLVGEGSSYSPPCNYHSSSPIAFVINF
uniref:Putative ovule protein n=1 Tax=Solanum chacoense TaxID=4108 RepID=A0A0V0GX29_SOLCH